MAEKDITQKTFMALNDVFADIFNVLVFRGNKVVAEKNLEEKTGFSQYKALDGVLHEQERDVFKHWNGNGFHLALAGIENQTIPNKDMPFRIIGYDGAAYRSQLLATEDTEEENAGRKEAANRYPVVTIVLYFGKAHWNYPKSLKESFYPPLPQGEIGQILEEYIQDYKVHIFDIPRLPKEVVAKFKSDFKVVAEYFTNVYTNPDYTPTGDKIRHVDEFLKVMRALTGDNRYESIAFSEEEKKEGIDMCRVLDYREARGEARGIQMGIEQGIERERLKGICNLMKNLSLSTEQAMEALGIPVKEQEKYRLLLQ